MMRRPPSSTLFPYPTLFGPRGWRLKMVLAAVDVVHRQRARRARIAGRGVGKPAGFGHRGVLAHRGGDRRVVVRAGDGDRNVFRTRGAEIIRNRIRSEEHTAELQTLKHLVWRFPPQKRDRVESVGAIG